MNAGYFKEFKNSPLTNHSCFATVTSPLAGAKFKGAAIGVHSWRYLLFKPQMALVLGELSPTATPSYPSLAEKFWV